jgi:hypothetical protein
MRQIAQPLKLGEMHERHFIFKEDWPQHLGRELAKAGGEVTVGALRAAMDRPQPKGLPTAVQNLLILIFAEHGQYAFTFHGGPYEDVSLKDIRDDLVLIKQDLAEPALWKQALDHAGALFGLTINPLRTANNQNALQKEVRDAAKTYLEPCRRLLADLTDQLGALGLSASGNRLANAKLAVAVLDDLQGREGPALVTALAGITPFTSLPALARSIIAATRVSNAIADNNWDLLEAVWDGGEGVRIKRAVADALAADELVTSLADALKQAQAQATRLIQRPPVVPPIDPPIVLPPGSEGKKVLKKDDRQGLEVDEARRVLKEIEPLLQDGVTLDIRYQIIADTEG